MLDSETAEHSEYSPLQRIVTAVSYDAFRLAQTAATSAGSSSALKRRAREVNTQLNELDALIEDAPTGEQAALRKAWSDARLDVGYVLSGGTLPKSSRMGLFLQGQC
ncbi:MAG TPA: hypothetical protein VGE45_08280 [Chloroflexia bacterium]|jgi:hypothetical protein